MFFNIYESCVKSFNFGLKLLIAFAFKVYLQEWNKKFYVCFSTNDLKCWLWEDKVRSRSFSRIDGLKMAGFKIGMFLRDVCK